MKIPDGIIALALGIVALATPAGLTAQSLIHKDMSLGTGQDYILGPSDVVEASIPGRTDFTTRARIDENGVIQLPYLGRLAASGRTSEQLAHEIAQALRDGGFFSNPVVTVEIVSFASKYVTVLGDVTTPGLIPIDRPYRLSEIIAKVGGVRDTGADYVVLRPLNGHEQRITIESLGRGDLAKDPFVAPGDKIFCPKADVFYVSGQVNQPGTYALTAGMTLRMAVARGGGLNSEGTLSKVIVTRHGKKLSGHDLERPVEPGDIIVVGERLF